MSSNHRVRASIFASPGGPSSAVPTKKRATNTFVFSDSIVEQSHTTHNTINKTLVAPCDVEEEPMEIDTSCVPSPVKEPIEKENLNEQELETSGHVPCTIATTPRRKSMPTPGKRLCFTSKEVNVHSDENDGKQENGDETTQLELLMSNNPEDVPNTVKALIEDNKAMKVYDQQVTKETETFQNILKNRNALLEKAKAQVEEPLSSRIPVPPADLFTVKKKTTEDVMQKLVENFLGNVLDASELSRKKLALNKLEESERIEQKMINLSLELHTIQEQKKLHGMKMSAEYKKLQAPLEEWKKKIERFDDILAKLKAVNNI